MNETYDGNKHLYPRSNLDSHKVNYQGFTYFFREVNCDAPNSVYKTMRVQFLEIIISNINSNK